MFRWFFHLSLSAHILRQSSSPEFFASEACHTPHFFFLLNIFTTFITVDAILKAVKA